MSKSSKNRGAKSVSISKIIEETYQIYNENDLLTVLDIIIMTEKDQDIVKEAMELYFQIRGYSIDEPFGRFDYERKRLLEDLK